MMASALGVVLVAAAAVTLGVLLLEQPPAEFAAEQPELAAPRSSMRAGGAGTALGADGLAVSSAGGAVLLDVLANDVLARAPQQPACLERPGGGLLLGAGRAAGGGGGGGGGFTDVTAEAGLGGLTQDVVRTAPGCLFDESAAAMGDTDGRVLYASSESCVTAEGFVEKIDAAERARWDAEVEENLLGSDERRRGTSREAMMVDNGGFCFPERNSGGGAVGDADGDGLPDVYVANMDGADHLLRNLGNGSFADVTRGAGLAGTAKFRTNGVAMGDLDNDGDLDVFLTTVADSRFHLMVNDGSGVFSEEAVKRGAAVKDGGRRRAGMSAALGDYDGDGWLDLHITEWLPHFLREREGAAEPRFRSSSRLLRNVGAARPGHFEDATESALGDVEAVSQALLERELQFKMEAMDEDKRVLSREQLRAKNEEHTAGKGKLRELTTVSNGMYGLSSTFSDVDGDGWLDLLVAADFGSSNLWWNNGDGTFTHDTTASGVGIDQNGMGSSVGDVDGDGDLDWFVSSIFDSEGKCAYGRCPFGWKGNMLYLNNGDRTFTEVAKEAGVHDSGWAWGSVLTDYDHDGDLDLACTAGYVMYETTFEDSWNCTRAPSSLCTVSCVLTT